MKCAVSAALLAATALGAAGCGSTTATNVALREARDSGGTQPRAVRVERWRLSNGDAVDVVLVRARFCGTRNGYTAPKINGRCLPSEVYFATRPGASGGSAAFLAHGDAHMTEEAWKARAAFRIFPDIPDLLVRCKIPRGAGGTVAGLCESKLSASRKVEFLEHWPLSKPHGHRNTAGWVVALDRSSRVLGVQRTGSTPPQATSASRASSSEP
jgi:hypothetical protein